MKFNFIFQLFLVQSFLKKIILLYLNEVWNYTSNIFPMISCPSLITDPHMDNYYKKIDYYTIIIDQTKIDAFLWVTSSTIQNWN